MDEAVQSKLMEYLSTIEKGVTDLAPKAYETALNLNYMHAVVNLFETLAFLSILVSVSLFLWGQAKRLHKEYMDWDDAFVPLMALGLTGFGVVIIMLCLCSSTGMWITLFNKELGLAYTIWEKFT